MTGRPLGPDEQALWARVTAGVRPLRRAAPVPREPVPLEAQGAVETFQKYADDLTVGAARFAGSVGDRVGPFSYRLAYNHLSSDNQPLTYATATTPKATSTIGTPVTGYASDASRLGAPIDVLGSTAIPHHEIDTLTGRLTYDPTPVLTAAYTFGLFRNDEHDTVASYLRDAAGAAVYAGALNLGGRAVTVSNSVFANNVYHLEDDQLAQGLSLSSHTGGAFDFEVIGTRYDTLKYRQRTANSALPAAFAGGPGYSISLDDTSWWTLDAKGTWRPGGSDASAHVATFGVHADDFKLNNPRYALADYLDGAAGGTQTFSRGHTETQAVWAQDRWRVLPAVIATVGLRLERWRAYDGLNFVAPAAATPGGLSAVQPEIESFRASPKFTLAWEPAAGWTLKGSLGVADRFPTVQELYQSSTVNGVVLVPNPNLKAEHALSSELSAERTWASGRARISLFGEEIDDALISQTGQIATGPNTSSAATFIQNVGHDRSRGVEFVAAQDVPGRVKLSGWLTYVDTRITRDTGFPNAIGKQIPQVPRLRGAVVAEWRPLDRLTATLAARYSDRSFGTIDNTDTYADTYQGFGAWLVADAHVRWRATGDVSVEAGVNNVTDRRYFVFHPFPGRTYVMDLKWTL